jgi:amino acid adenylation domain-containing protein
MIENVYPLSPLQEGIYYHWLVSPQSPVYFDQMSYVLQGQLDIEKIEAAYQKLVARHAILRTFFTQEFGDKALQVVRSDIGGNFVYQDCAAIQGFDPAVFKAEDRAKGFNLESGSQMRLTVLALGNDRHEFIWSFHHILMDGWCVGILVGEFFQFYTGLLQGIEPIMERVTPYATYIEWLGKTEQQESIDYWKGYLQGYESMCDLPKSSDLPGQSYQLKEEQILLDKATRQAIQALCAATGITENTFMQVVWGLLMTRYNNTNDVVFGTVVSGRPAEVEGVETMIGLFINTVPVRLRVGDTDTVLDLLKAQHEASIESTPHHYSQLAQIQAECSPGQELVSHILVFENYPVQKMIEQDIEAQQGASQGLQLLSTHSYEQTSYDFNLIVVPGADMVIRFSYNANVHDAANIARIKAHLLNVMQQVLDNQGMLANDVRYLGQEEEAQLLQTFNQTAAPYPSTETLAHLFEAQVAATPSKTALIFGDNSYTYAQLNEQANRLAACLLAKQNLQPNDCVGIMLPKSDLLVIAILGVLKAGAAYVPVDVENPPARNEFIVQETGIQLLVTLPELAAAATYFTGTVITPEAVAATPATGNPVMATGADDLAYIMFTSGSTGTPKGVVMPQKGAVRLVKSPNYIQFTGNEVLLTTAAQSFDACIFEYFGMLLNGGTVVVCGNDLLLDEQQLGAAIKAYGITTLWLTTGLLNQLVDRGLFIFEGLQTVLTGGDRVSPHHIYQLRQHCPVLEIVHMYGPTENGVFSTSFTVGDVAGNIAIGKPIANSTAYIMNQQRQLAAIGVIAEIYVGGDGLAKGYLNLPELTAEKFVPNPFAPGERLYRTGDLGRWLPDGNIEFIGRRDGQVKIRGFRVEVGEIENALASFPGITGAVVAVRHTGDGDKELIAYVSSKAPINDSTVLRIHLAGLLPHYMVPTFFVQLDELPLNVSGKVDRRRLPDPEGLGLGSGVEYVAPRNEIEEKLAAIWKEILGRDKIGVKDNFFAIGGHSLKATRMISQVRKVFNVSITLPVLFSNPTIEYLATEIDKTYWANNELFDIDDAENISI